MKLYSLAALSLAFLLWTGQQESTQRSQYTAETKLVGLANEFAEATNKKDRKKLDELMAPEYALYAWNGKLLAPRPVWLDNLFSHITIEKNTLPDFAPRIYGDFAIITSKGDWIGTFDGQHFNQKCIVVDTWRKHDGRWRVVTRTSDCTDQ
jgi:ketosteroid isomerase-like protein